jgi:hypothetical protein
VRLGTDNFPAATRLLREANFLAEERDGSLIALNPGVATHQVVSLLVGRGVPVHEIAPVEETLENFYLSLMNAHRQTSPQPDVLPPS